jgi:cysteine-rich CWC protein
MPNPQLVLLHELPTDERAMMSTGAGPTSPELQKRKTCQSCGQDFSCEAMAAGCWCEEIRLTAAAREEIARRYRECLCRNCLEQFVSEG